MCIQGPMFDITDAVQRTRKPHWRNAPNDSVGASAAAVDGEVPTSDMTLLFFPVSADARVAVFARQAIDHFLFFIAGVKTMALVPLVCGKRSPG